MFNAKLRKLIADSVTRRQLEPEAQEIQAALASSSPMSDIAKSKIVEHAVKHVPYYRRFSAYDFTDLPVINKSHMRADLRAFVADNVVLHKQATSTTSGSTGVPFTAFLSRGKVLRHRAGLVGSFRFAEADPYGPLLHSRAWAGITAQQRLKMMVLGHLPYAGTHEDSKNIGDIVQWLNRRTRVTIVGYSSYIEALLSAIDENRLTVDSDSIGAVIGSAEPPTANFVTTCQQVLSTTPRMRYSNMELGLIGITGCDIATYHLDTSSFHVEILEEESDSPVEPGQTGRIVVTDLHNETMPFIRYDTGDLGSFHVDEEGVEWRTRLTGIKGRRLDVLIGGTEENPRKLHSLQIWGPTSRITELRQFQLRQHAIGRFTWILNADKSISLETELRKILEDVVGSVEKCNFRYVDEVPVLASGKRQFFVNEISSK